MRIARFLAVAVGTALVLSGCDATSSETPLAPQASVVIAPTSSNSAKVAQTRSTKASNRNFVLVQPGVAGAVSVGGHTLRVPVGAIAQPTWFMLQVMEANAVHVRLQAWRAADWAPVTQFPNVPVELTVDVSDIETLDQNELLIVYLRDGTYSGAREPIRTVANGNNTITGYLTHFSQYAVAFAREYSPGID